MESNSFLVSPQLLPHCMSHDLSDNGFVIEHCAKRLGVRRESPLWIPFLAALDRSKPAMHAELKGALRKTPADPASDCAFRNSEFDRAPR